MQLIKLSTTNFKKLGNAEFNFTDGLNVIVGDNAQGKSTLLQAIEAALFGVTVVPGKKENVPTWGQTTFGLELHFTGDGGESVYRLTRTKSTAKLVRTSYEDGEELLANGNTPVTAYIEELLGLTAKDWNLFVQSKQGETAGILTFGGAALSRKVEEFAGVDVIDAVQSKAGERSRKAAAEAEANSVSPEERDAAQQLADEVSDELAKAKAGLTAAEAELNNLQHPALPVVPVPSEELAKRRREVDRALAARREAELAVVHCRQVLAELQENPVEKPATDAAGYDEQVNALKAERKAVLGQQKELNQTVHAYNEAVRSLDEARAELAKVVVPEFDQAELDRRQQELEGAAEAVATLNLRISQIKGMQKDAVCGACGTKLTEHDPEKLAAELDKLTADAASEEGQRKVLAAEIRNLEKAKAQRNAAETEVRRLQAAIDKHAAAVEAGSPDEAVKSLAEIDQTLLTLSEGIASANHSASQAANAADAWAKYKRKRQRAVTALQDAEAAFEGMVDPGTAPTDVEIDTVAQLEAANRAAQQAHIQQTNQLKHAVSQAASAVALKQEQLTTAEKNLDRLRDRSAAHAEKAVAADVARRLSRFLGDKRADYLKDVWATVLGAASRQVSLATNGLITAVNYRDGEFLFTEDGIEAPVTSASGAQKAFLGVSVRIGLARALYGNDSLLILDEPTESMSEGNATRLVGGLAGTAKQILLITHREQDQVLANNIISL